MGRKSGTRGKNMPTAKSNVDYEVFEFDIIGDDVITHASRERDSNPTNGVWHRSFLSIPTNNFKPADSIPWFDPGNNEPEYLMRLIADNPVLLGLILTKCSILHGQGLSLMKKNEKGEPTPLPKEEWPSEILEFYDYNELDTLTYQWFTDFEMLGNAFPNIIFSPRVDLINKKREVADIYRISPECVRAIKPKRATEEISKYIIAPKWDTIQGQEGVEIPAYNHKAFYNEERKFEPGKDVANSVLWHIKRKTPGFPAYGIPHWFGARYYVEMQNEIPLLHIANVINQWGARMKVSVSKKYIDQKRQLTNPSTNKPYTTEEIREEISERFRDLFTKPENTGKSLVVAHEIHHSGERIDDIYVEMIKVDMKDDAYVALEELIHSKITSSVGVQSHLANIITKKGMSSGSELTQAWNIEVAKARTTQNKILAPINFSHKYNGWHIDYPDLSWGFPSPSLVTQDIAKGGMITKEEFPSNEGETPDPQQKEEENAV